LGHVLTYRSLCAQSRVLARKLLDAGARRGDRVAIVAETDPMFHLVFFAAQYAGLLPVALPAGVQLGAHDAYVEQLRRMLEGCGAVIAVAPETHIGFLREASSALDGIQVVMKKLFTGNGFIIPYDTDLDEPLADGFYFTLSYPGMTSYQLLEKILYYGISAISLDITGSKRNDGLRACVSHVGKDQFGDLELRLKRFSLDHPF
jgi:hypothetical protein